jgi:hypothetical protein
MCDVLFEVHTEVLNIIYTSFGVKWYGICKINAENNILYER